MTQYKKKTSSNKKSGGYTHYTRRRKSGYKSASAKRKLSPEQIEKMQEGRRVAAEKKKNEEITKNRLEAISDLNRTISKNSKFAEKADEFAFAKRNRYLEKHRGGGGKR